MWIVGQRAATRWFVAVFCLFFFDLLGAFTCAATELSAVLLSVPIGRGPMTLGH